MSVHAPLIGSRALWSAHAVAVGTHGGVVGTGGGGAGQVPASDRPFRSDRSRNRGNGAWRTRTGDGCRAGTSKLTAATCRSTEQSHSHAAVRVRIGGLCLGPMNSAPSIELGFCDSTVRLAVAAYLREGWRRRQRDRRHGADDASDRERNEFGRPVRHVIPRIVERQAHNPRRGRSWRLHPDGRGVVAAGIRCGEQVETCASGSTRPPDIGMSARGQRHVSALGASPAEVSHDVGALRR
jgi:hypothetical protein